MLYSIFLEIRRVGVCRVHLFKIATAWYTLVEASVRLHYLVTAIFAIIKQYISNMIILCGRLCSLKKRIRVIREKKILGTQWIKRNEYNIEKQHLLHWIEWWPNNWYSRNPTKINFQKLSIMGCVIFPCQTIKIWILKTQIIQRPFLR